MHILISDKKKKKEIREICVLFCVAVCWGRRQWSLCKPVFPRICTLATSKWGLPAFSRADVERILCDRAETTAKRTSVSSTSWLMGRSSNRISSLLKRKKERCKHSVQKNSFRFDSIQCNWNELQYSPIYSLNIHSHPSCLSLRISQQMLQCLILKISWPPCIFPITLAARPPLPTIGYFLYGNKGIWG